MIKQHNLTVETRGRESLEISAEVQAFVKASGVNVGLCNVFIQHSSASLMICENADATVRSDLERYMKRLVPDGDKLFEHVAEGDDDMPAHIRSILTGSHITLPVSAGRCLLGIWQGIYLWEHRTHAHTRKICLTVYGE